MAIELDIHMKTTDLQRKKKRKKDISDLDHCGSVPFKH
jgi:hypothetical protein